MPDTPRRRRRSPLQKPFDPGTQDFDTPLTTPLVGGGDPGSEKKEDPPTTKPRRARARTHTHNLSGGKNPTPGCAGIGWEDRDFQHSEDAHLVVHLQLFFNHTWADRFVEEFGRQLINRALGEISSWRGVKLPAAYLVMRVRALSQGALPMGNLEVPAQHTQPDPEAYIKEYVRRRGHMPGEETE